MTRFTICIAATLAGSLACSPASAAPENVRRDVARLAAQGELEEALSLVETRAESLPPEWQAMFAAKLELGGEASAQGYTRAAAETSPPDMRGEALFRLGQYHYAAGRYNLAIPQFRRYVAESPRGEWADAASYWMAHACLLYAAQRPGREAYLDTALAYIARVEARGHDAYYWPLAKAARARVALARGDRPAAATALADARSSSPAEEMPGVLLLSLQAQPDAREAADWEDSLRWQYPLSPEAALLPPPARAASPASTGAPAAIPRQPGTAAATPPGHALQLGAFSQRENAERLRNELAGRRLDARVEVFEAGGRILYRVAVGNFPDAETAAREGRRLLTPLGYEFRVISP